MSDNVLRSMLEADSLRHRDLMEAIKTLSDRITSNIDALTMQVVQMNVGIKQNSQNLDKLTQAIERQNTAIDGHLTVAREQAANIAQLIELAKQQQATVEKFLSKN